MVADTTWTSAGASKLCDTDPKVHTTMAVNLMPWGGVFAVSIRISIPRPCNTNEYRHLTTLMLLQTKVIL